MGLATKIALVPVVFALNSGCAVYYHDAKTGAEHIWGFGHLETKVTPPSEGKQAVIRRATLSGLAFGIEDDAIGLSAGWARRERITVYGDNTSLAIQRPPSDDYFMFKIGALPPNVPTEHPDQPATHEDKLP
jgi:hypothetical protein